MTNSLHRYGDPASMEDDYIVFAMAARGLNDRGSTEKFQKFLAIARQYRPVNLGDATQGGLYRPMKRLTPLVHWGHREAIDADELIAGVEGPTVVSAVFDDPSSVVGFLREIKEADLGLSINLSSLTGRAEDLARQAGITRHSVEFSLGFFGALDKLPDRRTLELTTMCGHGMISFELAGKMIGWVKEDRRSPEQASLTMARFCTCGIFNTSRSARILRECRGRR